MFQKNKFGQEVTESLQRAPLHLEADLVERASNLELSTPINISETRTQGLLENASQTSPTSRNVPQVQLSPEGNVARHTGAKTAESHSSQQKPSNDPPSVSGEKLTPGNNGPPGETPKPDSGSPGENPIPDPPKENPTLGPPRKAHTPDNNGPPGTPGKNYIPGTTDNSAYQPNHEASGGNKDSDPTGNPKVSCFCEFMLCVYREPIENHSYLLN